MALIIVLEEINQVNEEMRKIYHIFLWLHAYLISNIFNVCLFGVRKEHIVILKVLFIYFHSFTGTDPSPVFLRSLAFRSRRPRPRVSDPLPFAHELFLLGRRRSSSPKPFSQLSRFHDYSSSRNAGHHYQYHQRRGSDISPLHQRYYKWFMIHHCKIFDLSSN